MRNIMREKKKIKVEESTKVEPSEASVIKSRKTAGDLFKGHIRGLICSSGSGCAELIIQDENGEIQNILCENSTTVSSLEEAFGNVITENLTINEEGGHLNKEIYYSVNNYGILEWFIPTEFAPIELHEEYEESQAFLKVNPQNKTKMVVRMRKVNDEKKTKKLVAI
jgi:hypothetical protein